MICVLSSLSFRRLLAIQSRTRSRQPAKRSIASWHEAAGTLIYSYMLGLKQLCPTGFQCGCLYRRVYACALRTALVSYIMSVGQAWFLLRTVSSMQSDGAPGYDSLIARHCSMASHARTPAYATRPTSHTGRQQTDTSIGVYVPLVVRRLVGHGRRFKGLCQLTDLYCL